MGNKQREGIRRTALECLEHYELIIRRIRNLCADFDSMDLIDPGSMALQLRMLLIDSSSRTGGRSVMNLMGVTNAQRILSKVIGSLNFSESDQVDSFRVPVICDGLQPC